jgi:hypothetical protein
MQMDDRLAALIEKFRAVGSADPESWAASEINEDIAQFARFVFLRELWKLVVPKDSREWLRHLELPNDDGRGGVRRRLKESSASMDDLTELVRASQSEVFRNVAYLLDSCASEDDHIDEVGWGLYGLDDTGTPVRKMDGLHESVEDVRP